MNNFELHQGDCLDIMPKIDTNSVNLILTDLPYGTTQAHWDSVIDLNKMWEQYKRIIKDDGVIALFAQLPFDKVLGASNLDMLRYEITWHKNKATGHLNAKKMPLKAHENILFFSDSIENIMVFYKKLPTYNPQKTTGHERKVSKTGRTYDSDCYGKESNKPHYDSTDRYPTDVIEFPVVPHTERIHVNEKPVGLLEIIIKTFTNEGDTVFDSCYGSGACGEASLNCRRKFIGIERDTEIFTTGKERILQSQKQARLFA